MVYPIKVWEELVGHLEHVESTQLGIALTVGLPGGNEKYRFDIPKECIRSEKLRKNLFNATDKRVGVLRTDIPCKEFVVRVVEEVEI